MSSFAGVPGGPNGGLSPEAEAYSPFLGQRCWMSPALFLPEFDSSRPQVVAAVEGQPIPLERVSLWRAQPPPHSTPGRVSTGSEPRPPWRPLEWSSVRGAREARKVLLGGQGMASAFSLRHGCLTLSCCTPWPCWGPRHSGGYEAGAALSGHSLALGFLSLSPGA